MHRFVRSVIFSVLGYTAGFAGMQTAGAAYIDQDNTLLGVVVQPSTLGHRHLVYPTRYQLDIQDPEANSGEFFSLTFATRDLGNDDPMMVMRWQQDILDAGILDEPYTEISASDRATINEHLLASNQLDADNYPSISVRVSNLKANPNYPETASYSHDAYLTMRVHGVERVKPIQITLQRDDDKLVVDGKTYFNFTDFGFRPYSALGGIYANRNRFDLFCHLEVTL